MSPDTDDWARVHRAMADASRRSARAVLPPLLDRLRPRSVVDVGCGLGTWLAVCREHGVPEVVGVDGDHVERDHLEIAPGSFRTADLERPLHLDRQTTGPGAAFDLAVSVEVAEHLSPGRADGFVADLTRLAPVVLFGAAIPGQGGLHHVNEQWPSRWVERFAERGFVAVDCVRGAVWDDPDVDWWYAQNTLVYVDSARPDLLDRLADLPRLEPAGLALVHPTLLSHHAEATRRRGARTQWTDALRATERAVRRRLGRPRRRG